MTNPDGGAAFPMPSEKGAGPVTDRVDDATLRAIIEASEAATAQPWSVDPDMREGCEWNNHIIGPDGNRICFMAHNPSDNSRLETAAHFITLACNNAAAMARELAEARERIEELRATLAASATEKERAAWLEGLRNSLATVESIETNDPGHCRYTQREISQILRDNIALALQQKGPSDV